jgi:ribosomal-protein-alanine N-acetyltransferase
MNIIETSRFSLREFAAEDAENLYLLNKDPEVLRYTGDSPFDSIEAAASFVDNYDQYRKFGYGRWAVIQKSDAAFLGWCGLKFRPGPDKCDLGFRLFRSAWNRGVATETATACLDYGFEVLDLERIVGRAMKANTASISVFRKIGLKYFGDFEFEGREAVIYDLDRPSWQARR